MLLRILDTALDDGEEHLCLGFVEMRTQSKLGDLKIQAGTKWVPWCFEYRRIWGIGSKWSIDSDRLGVAIVGKVLIRPATIWMKFDLDIVKEGMVWTVTIGRIRFQV